MALSESESPAKARPAPSGAADAPKPRIELLTPADADGALVLSDAAGWNQVAADWQAFIAHGRVFGCRDGDGRWVATAAALPYGDRVGWVSMVLVAEAWRHRGLASMLVRECVAELQSRAILPLLDATPAGAAVYRSLGFADGFAFERWQTDAAAAALSGSVAMSAPPRIRPAARADHERIVALDAALSGFDRRFLLERFLERPDSRAWLTERGDAFIIARAGRRATQIGPLAAAGDEEAITLLAAALAATPGPAFIDVPVGRAGLVGWLAQRGFVQQRSFVRMALGAAPSREADARCYALAGPEFG